MTHERNSGTRRGRLLANLAFVLATLIAMTFPYVYPAVLLTSQPTVA